MIYVACQKIVTPLSYSRNVKQLRDTKISNQLANLKSSDVKLKYSAV